jgi:hypothetical protein
VNDPSRREILKLAGLASTGLLGIPIPDLGRLAGVDERRMAHDLFFGMEELEVMRRHFRTNTMFADFRDSLESIDRLAERRFMAEEVKYNDQLFHILRLSRLAENMAFLHLMKGDTDAADLSAEAIRSIMKFDRWDYFLEAGTKVVGIQRASSTAIAVCVASDWLGEHISDEERRTWIDVLMERGCEATYLALLGMRHPDQVAGWTRDETSTYFEHRPGDRADLSRRHIIINSTNLKAVPAAALAIGAVTCLKHLGDSLIRLLHGHTAHPGGNGPRTCRADRPG